ncbi:hypothetical protein Q5752_004173 [Cryptotrichosporon argae]
MDPIVADKDLPVDRAIADEEAGVYRHRSGGIKGAANRAMELLVEHGVEERGIQPRPEDERDTLSMWSYFPQFTLWAAMNTNILTFSEGMLGPQFFGLDLKSSVMVIVVFTAVCALAPAWLACNGPRTGMRQMVQARFALGYYPSMFIGLVNCISFVGYLSLTAILGGQCLSLASNSDMTWTVGIVIVAIIALLLSFVGLRALHILSLASFPIVMLLFIVLAGVTGDKLKLATSSAVEAVSGISTSGVLAYGASQIGFTISYTSFASDFTTSLPAHTPRLPLFLCVYAGLAVPIILVQVFAAAAQCAAVAIPAWTAASAVGTPDLLYAMAGAGGAARFAMVLLCLGVVANTAPTIYSCGLSGQVAIPWLVRVPRYFLAVVVTAIYLPVAIVGSTHFYTVLENFLSVLGYYTSLYIPPVILEPILFRNPVSRTTYPLDTWDKPSKLPIGIAWVAGAVVGIPLIAAGMAQTWWTGWIAAAIPGGDGDIGFLLSCSAVTLVWIPVRYLERRRTGR